MPVIWLIAHSPTEKAAALRTKSRRLIPIRRRWRSVSRSASAMIASWSGVGSPGRNSPLEHGRTSTGSPSHGSGNDFFQVIKRLPSSLVKHSGGYPKDYLTTRIAPRIPGWILQKNEYVPVCVGVNSQ